jgi:hypothetical protein
MYVMYISVCTTNSLWCCVRYGNTVQRHELPSVGRWICHISLSVVSYSHFHAKSLKPIYSILHFFSIEYYGWIVSTRSGVLNVTMLLFMGRIFRVKL